MALRSSTADLTASQIRRGNRTHQLLRKLGIYDSLKYLSRDGVYRGPISLDTPTDTVMVGAFASTASGSGIAISSSRTAAVKLYSDDAGASIGASVRGLLSRFLITANQTGGTIRGLMGQVKFAGTRTTSGSLVYGVQGYIEANNTLTVDSYMAAVDGALELGGNTTVSANSFLSGLQAILNTSDSIIETGDMQGLYIGIDNGTTKWPKGIYITGSDVGIEIGACTTGISFTGDATTAINIGAGCTPTDGILIAGACVDGIHLSGANTTAAIHISGDQAVGILYDVDEDAADGIVFDVDTNKTLSSGIEMSGAGTITTGLIFTPDHCTAAILIGGAATTTGISITANGLTDGIKISGPTPVDGIEISSACSGYGINISGACTTGLAIVGSTTAGISITGGSNTALIIGADGTNSGDVFIYGTASGTYVEWDNNANEQGRFKVVEASTRLTCSHHDGQNTGLGNECCLSARQSHNVTTTTGQTQGGRAILGWYTLESTFTNASELSWAAMFGIEGTVVLDGALNGSAVNVFGVAGELRGSGTQVECQDIAPLAALNNNSVNPTTGRKSMIYSCNGAGTVDAVLTHQGSSTALFDFNDASGFVLEDDKAWGSKAGSLKIIMPSGGTGYINIYDGSAGS